MKRNNFSSTKAMGIFKGISNHINSENETSVPTTPKYWGRLAGLLMIIISVMSFVFPPSSLQKVKLSDIYILTAFMFIFGVIFYVSKWTWWTLRKQLALFTLVASCALAAIGYAYGPIYGPIELEILPMILAVWVGVTQPQFTSLFLFPVIALDELTPIYTLKQSVEKSSVIALVVAVSYVVVAELLGRLISILRRAERVAKDSEAIARQKEDEAIYKSETLRVLFETSPDIIIMLDFAGTIVKASDSADPILGELSSTLEGKNILEESIIAEESLEGVKAATFKLLDESLTQVRVRFKLNKEKFKKDIVLEANIRPLFDPTLRVVNLVAVARDVTEQAKLEERLKQAMEDAEFANRAKTDFLARMSHELRTPLNAILGFSQLLAGDDLDDIQKDSLDRIVGAGKHLLNLINEVLDLAKVESGHVSLQMDKFSFKSIVDDVFLLMLPLAESRNIIIHPPIYKVEEDCGVVADKQRLKQILINLVSNAVKYNSENGSVSIEIEESYMDETNYVRFNVIDTGIGIKESDYAKVFTPFERLGKESSGIEGTGVGLALCKEIAVEMDGDITFESKLNAGSVFTLSLLHCKIEPTLKLSESMSSYRNREQTNIGKAGVKDYTVLYIEDILENVVLVERITAKMPQINLVTSMTGEDGLRVLRESQVSLLLLDLHLPDIQGEEILRVVRSSSEIADLPVVIVSASAMEEDIKRLMSIGANAYLTKPISVSEFETTISQFLFTV